MHLVVKHFPYVFIGSNLFPFNDSILLLLVVEFNRCQSKFCNDCCMITSYSQFCDFTVTNSFKKLITAYEIVLHVCQILVVEQPMSNIVVVLKIR